MTCVKNKMGILIVEEDPKVQHQEVVASPCVETLEDGPAVTEFLRKL